MTTTTSPSRSSAALEYVSGLVEEGGLPTAVLGVATADGVVALEAFGTSGTRSIRSGDHFRLFSITKPLIGLIAARELERGTLTLDAALTDALPTFGHHRDDTVPSATSPRTPRASPSQSSTTHAPCARPC